MMLEDDDTSLKVSSRFIKGFFKAKHWMLTVLNNNMSTAEDATERETFVTRLLLQIIITWIIQQWSVLDEDPRFLLTKFEQRDSLEYSCYFELLKDLFTTMQCSEPSNHIHFRVHPRLGKILVLGEMFFLINRNTKYWSMTIEDEAFFIKNLHISLERSLQQSSNDPYPILNFLDEWNRRQLPIDGFTVGSILEQLDAPDRRHSQGKFYTPKHVVFRMVHETLIAKLQEHVNEKNQLEMPLRSLEDLLTNISINSTTVREMLNDLLQITLLDPAVGSGHFLEAAARVLTSTFVTLLQHLKQARNDYHESRLHWINETRDQQSRKFKKNRYRDDSWHHDLTRVVKSWLNNEEPNLDESSLKFSFLYHHVLPFSLHGVDISKDSLQLTRIRLILVLIECGARYLQEQPTNIIPLSSDHFNLYHGNALLGILQYQEQQPSSADSNHMTENWQPSIDHSRPRHPSNHDPTEKLARSLGEPPRILRKYHPLHWNVIFNRMPPMNDKIREKRRKNKGFDIIIGNPPYVSAKTLPKELKKIMKKLYQTARGQYDLFSLFVERSLQLTRPRGIISFILPDAVLDRSTFAPLRRLLLKNTTILFIHQIKDVFNDPTVSNVIITIKKELPASSSHLVHHAVHESVNHFITTATTMETTPQQWFTTTRKQAFLLLPARHRNLIAKIQQQVQPLGDFIQIFRGEEIGKKSPALKPQKCCQECHPVLTGSDIQPYHINFSEHYLHPTDIHKSGYFQPKILIRQLGNRIHAALDQHGQYVSLQTVYNLIVKPSMSLRPRFLLAFLNSHLMNYYYTLMFKQKRLFPRILIENIRDLPLKIPMPALHDLTCDLVRQIESRTLRSNKNEEDSMSLTTRKIRARLEAVIFRLYQITAEEARQIMTFLNIDEREVRLILDHLEDASE